MVVAIRVVVERALRRSFVSPGLERRQVIEGRKVVASARVTIFSIAFGCDRCASGLFAAGLLLVKDQIPRNEGGEAALRTRRRPGAIDSKEIRQRAANPQRELWAICSRHR